MEQYPQEELDRSIQRQYQDICFNPDKKTTLRRLIQQPRLYQEMIDQSSYFSQKQPIDVANNESLNMYIQHVYHKYNIQDPLNKAFRNGQTQDTRDTFMNTPYKQTCKMQQTTKSQTITTTKRKILQMRQKYKQECNDVISSVIYPTQFTHREIQDSGLGRSRIAKQIGFRTMQKIHFKNRTHEDISSLQTNFQSQIPIKTARKQSHKITFNQNPQQPQITRKRAVSEIPVSFRYCPMCQQVILHENIASHEANCRQIQEAYQLPMKELQKEITAKILRLKDRIQEQIISCEDQKILKEYSNLKGSLISWMNNEDEQSFQKVRNYQEQTLKQFELISKLRWFKKIHTNMMSKMSQVSK